MNERSAHVLIGEEAPGIVPPPPARPPLASVVDHLVREISAGVRVLGLIGPADSGSREVLDLLSARLVGSRTTLRSTGGILFPDEQASRLLVSLRAPPSADACAAFEARAREIVDAGQPILIALHGGDSLLPETAHWLATLTKPPQPVVQIVVACQLESILQRSFPPEIGPIQVLHMEDVAPPARTPPHGERPAPDEFRLEFVPGSSEPVIALPGAPPEEERDLPELTSAIEPRAAPRSGAEGSPRLPGGGREAAAEGPLLATTDRSSGQIDADSPARTEEEGRAGSVPSATATAIARGQVPGVEERSTRSGKRLLANSIAVFSIVLAVGFSLGVMLPLLSTSPVRIAPERHGPQQEAARPARATRTPVARSDLRPTGPPARTEPSPSRGTLDVFYDPSTERIRVAARGVPLEDLLTVIAWQTGLHLESDVDLSREVDARFENVSLDEALDRLLVGYHSIVLRSPEPDDPYPFSIWVLIERPESPAVAQALESVLHSHDPTRREDAARWLDRQGTTSEAYALVDALSRAHTWEPAESRFVSDVRDRVTDCLCRTWAASAVGPQANSLRCG